MIEHHNTLKLTLEDGEALANALLQPPEPNVTLEQGAVRYQEKMVTHGNYNSAPG